MPTPISDFVTNLQEALSGVPPTIIALALIAGPTAAWFLLRGAGFGRPRRAPATTSNDLLWVCDSCSSINELRHHRCYRCGHVPAATASLRFIDVGTTTQILTARADTAVTPETDAHAPDRSLPAVLGAAVAGWRHTLFGKRRHRPSYRIVVTPTGAARATSAASASPVAPAPPVGAAEPSTPVAARSPAPRSAGSGSHAAAVPVMATTSDAVPVMPATADAVPVMTATTDAVPVMASAEPAPGVAAEAHPGLAVGAKRPFEVELEADAAPVAVATASAASDVTLGPAPQSMPWSAPTEAPKPTTAIIAPRRIVTSAPAKPIAPGTPITLPPLPHGALALETPALKAQRAAARQAAARDRATGSPNERPRHAATSTSATASTSGTPSATAPGRATD